MSLNPFGSMVGDLSNYFNGGLMGGYQNFGNQLQNAMGAFGNVAMLNSANNQALNNANANYAAQYQAPVDVARINQEGQNQRLQALSPLLSGLFGGGSGGGGGLTGFNAVGADGKSYASASLGGGGAAGGGSSGGQLGQPQPGNASTAQPTNVAKYNYIRQPPPEQLASAMANFRQYGTYTAPGYVKPAGLSG